MAESKATNITWHEGHVGRDERNELLEQKGATIWFTGLSGSGKSTIALAILGLLGMRGGTARGEIMFAGADLLRMPERRLREIRGRRIALVPQSPIASLNPAAWRMSATCGQASAMP